MHSIYLPSSENCMTDKPSTLTSVSALANQGKFNRLTVTRDTFSTSQLRHRKHHCLAIIILLLGGDIQTNPGPKTASVYPCGFCEQPVTWSQLAVCCCNCSIWYHKSCEGLKTKDMSRLGHDSVVWLCYKCDSINVENFTFNHFELETSNTFYPLSPDAKSSVDSFVSDDLLDNMPNPVCESSPKSPNEGQRRRGRRSAKSHTGSSSSPSSSTSQGSSGSPPIHPKRTNLRVLNVNCCSIRSNRSEFIAAMDYVKPDIICGTESWLTGIKPGKDPTDDAIKSSEVFPDSHFFHRNDRETTGGGVFVGIARSMTADCRPDLVANCEIIWTKVKLQGSTSRDLYCGSFYMPHRNLSHLDQLRASLGLILNSNKGKQIILAGDFNCPDIDWDSLCVRPGAPDREVQQASIDISVEYGLTQVHN